MDWCGGIGILVCIFLSCQRFVLFAFSQVQGVRRRCETWGADASFCRFSIPLWIPVAFDWNAKGCSTVLRSLCIYPICAAPAPCRAPRRTPSAPMSSRWWGAMEAYRAYGGGALSPRWGFDVLQRCRSQWTYAMDRNTQLPRSCGYATF